MITELNMLPDYPDQEPRTTPAHWDLSELLSPDVAEETAQAAPDGAASVQAESETAGQPADAEPMPGLSERGVLDSLVEPRTTPVHWNLSEWL